MKLTTVFFIATLNIIWQDLSAQCLKLGPESPSMAGNNTGIGTVAWLGLGNIYNSDGLYASATGVSSGNISNYLIVSGFGFSAPAGAHICGVTVEVEKNSIGILENVTDYSVRLVKGDVLLGSNKATAGIWPKSNSYFVHGGQNDLWGATLTADDVNAENFGIAISATLAGSGAMPTARIDHIQLTVYYTIPLPINLISFKAIRSNTSTVNLEWSTASEINNQYFSVEQSSDLKEWQTLKMINGAGNSNSTLHYSYKDENTNRHITYYRLKQTDFDGQNSYSKTVKVSPWTKQESSKINVYPNPSSGNIKLNTEINISQLVVLNSMAEIVQTTNYNCSGVNKNYEYDLPPAKDWGYILKLTDCEGNIYHERVIIK